MCSSHPPMAGIQMASVGTSGAKLPRTGSTAPREGLRQPAQVEGLGFTRGVCTTLSRRKWKPGRRVHTAGPASCVEQTYIFLCSTRAIRSPGLMSSLHSFGLRIQSPTQGTDSTTGSQGNTGPKASAASSCWIFSASCVPAHPLVTPIRSGCLYPRILLCPSWKVLGSIPCPP